MAAHRLLPQDSAGSWLNMAKSELNVLSGKCLSIESKVMADRKFRELPYLGSPILASA
jgi:hypothetical protein